MVLTKKYTNNSSINLSGSEISQAPPPLEASRALSTHLFFLEHCPMNVLGSTT
jgi:hypothetical protein